MYMSELLKSEIASESSDWKICKNKYGELWSVELTE